MHPNILTAETTYVSLQVCEEARDYYFHFGNNKTEAQKGEVSNSGLVLGGVRIFLSPDPVLKGMIIRFLCHHCGHCHLHRGYKKVYAGEHIELQGDEPGIPSRHHLLVIFRIGGASLTAL